MAKIKPTLANLEREEKAIATCFDSANATASSLREHVYNIKNHELWKAVDCSSFKQYCQLGRIKYDGKKITLKYDQLGKLATNGEIEGHIPKNEVSFFSEWALMALGQLRVEFKDSVTGEVTRRTHDLDIKKIKAIVAKVINERAKAVTNGKSKNDSQITAKVVKEAIEQKYGYKPPKTMAATLKTEQKRINRFLSSLEAAIEMNDSLFDDAEEESAGCAKRLATVYSKIASFLRRM